MYNQYSFQEKFRSILEQTLKAVISIHPKSNETPLGHVNTHATNGQNGFKRVLKLV